jgi:hypothetical protein
MAMFAMVLDSLLGKSIALKLTYPADSTTIFSQDCIRFIIFVTVVTMVPEPLPPKPLTFPADSLAPVVPARVCLIKIVTFFAVAIEPIPARQFDPQRAVLPNIFCAVFLANYAQAEEPSMQAGRYSLGTRDNAQVREFGYDYVRRVSCPDRRDHVERFDEHARVMP